MRLQDATVLVTGAGSGIGRAIACALGGEGACVAMMGRTASSLEQTAALVTGRGGTSLVVPGDVTRRDEVDAVVSSVIERRGRVDALVNNAGLGVFRELHEMSIDDWDTQLRVMLDGVFLVTRAVLPHMYQGGGGHIVTISSLWAQKYCGRCAAYTAAKHGVRGMMLSLREEARSRGVRVTNVMPGTVDTPFFDKNDWDADLSRALDPDDVARTVVFALSMPGTAVIEEVSLQALNPSGCTE